MAINIMPPVLTLEQKAKLKKLDGMLSIKDIAMLRHHENEDLIQPYAYDIAEACLKGELDFIHGVQAHDLRWLYEHPETETILELPIDFESSPWPGSEAYSDINSAWCLESEWTGDPHPKPAYKYNDNSAKLRRLYANNHNSAAYDFYRFDYAMGMRCLIGAETFKDWLIKKQDYPLPVGCLLEDWFKSVEIANNYLRTNWPEKKQAESKDIEILTQNDKRNKVAKAWIESLPKPPDWDSLKTGKIKTCLQGFYATFRKNNPDYPEGLFLKGVDDWLGRDHRVIPKRQAGKKPGK